MPHLWLLLLSFAISHGLDFNFTDYRCDPCIDRPSNTIKAIVHGTQADPFWLQLRAGALQSAKDMRVQLDFDLEDAYGPSRMAQAIREAAKAGYDALLMSLPTQQVADAAAQALEMGIPVLGINSGDTLAEDSVLSWVGMDDYQGGVAASAEVLKSFQR